MARPGKPLSESCAAFAARLSVSERRVRALVALGMPAARGPRGAHLIPVDAALAWHAAHARAGTHGGARPGAGRPRGAARSKPLHGGREAGTESPLPAAGRAALPTRVEADILHKVAQAKLTDLRYRERRAELWRVRDVEAALGRLWGHASETLRALPAAAAADVCAECGFPAEDAPRVERALRRRVDDVLALLRDVDLGRAA